MDGLLFEGSQTVCPVVTIAGLARHGRCILLEAATSCFPFASQQRPVQEVSDWPQILMCPLGSPDRAINTLTQIQLADWTSYI